MNSLQVKFSQHLELPGQTLLGICACAGIAIQRPTLYKICKAILAYEVHPKNIDLAIDELLSQKWLVAQQNRLGIPCPELSSDLVGRLICSKKTESFFRVLDVYLPKVNLQWGINITAEDRIHLSYAYRRSFILGEPSFPRFCEQHAHQLKRYSNLWLGDLLYRADATGLLAFNRDQLHLALSFGLSEGSPSPTALAETIKWLWSQLDQTEQGAFYDSVHDVLRAYGSFGIMEHFLKQIQKHNELQSLDLGLVHLVHHRLDKAIACFESCSLEQTEFGFQIKTALIFSDPWRLLYIFALLLRHKGDDLIKVEQALTADQNRAITGGHRALLALLQFAKGDLGLAKITLFNQRYRSTPQHLICELLITYAERTIIGFCPTAELHQQRVVFINQQRSSHGWWVNELEGMLVKPLSSTAKKKPKHRKTPPRQQRSSSLNIRRPASLNIPFHSIDKTQQLQYKLQQLDDLLEVDVHQDSKGDRPQRVLWELNFDHDNNLLSVLPKVQHQENFRWLAGQALDLSKRTLMDKQDLQLPQDRLAYQTLHLLKQRSEYWGNAEEFTIDIGEVLPCLIGHPHLIDGTTGSALRLQHHPLTLIITRLQDGMIIDTQPHTEPNRDFALERIDTSTLLFSSISRQQKQLLSLLNIGSKIPSTLSKRLGPVIKKLSSHFEIIELTN